MKRKTIVNRIYFFSDFSRSSILSIRPELLLLYFSAINVLSIILIGYHYEFIKCAFLDFFPNPSNTEFIIESLKLLGAAIYAGFVALLVTNVWQQKSLGFEMLKELNSPEFFEVRSVLSTQKRIAHKNGIDLDNIETWFPPIDIPIPQKIKINTTRLFIREHALSSMLYYIIRLSNYGRSGMINLQLTKNLFNNFFAHYNLLMLEFAGAIEDYFENDYLSKIGKGKRRAKRLWSRRINDIKYFFYIMELMYELPEGYQYKYFPSVNGELEPSKKGRYVTDYDLDEYKESDSLHIISELNRMKLDLANLMELLE